MTNIRLQNPYMDETIKVKENLKRILDMKNKERLEKYLGASINVDVIYQCLGNGINPTLTKEFINSGFSMNLLFSEVDDEND